VPPRPVWTIAEYGAANALCRELTGSGLSVQAFRLLPKMLEADRHPGLFEVHPELVFHRLNGGPLPYGKKTWNGQQVRRRLLADAGVVVPDDLGPAGVAPADDVLDAAAVAHAAYRITRSVAVALPEVAEYDGSGRRIAIWS
jgi:predicted RNase H-like nuclease